MASTPITNQPVPPTGRAAPDPRGRRIAVILWLFAVCMVMVVPMALRYHALSPFDEATHADYAWQVAHGHIPDRGSILAPEIQREIACRPGTTTVGPPLAYCGQKNPPLNVLPGNGLDYNFGHPPVYYAITGVLARLAEAAHPGHFIAYARLVGIGWLFAAALVLYTTLRRLRVTWWVALAAATGMIANPAMYFSDATVTNDAAAALGGALAVWILARIFVSKQYGWVVPAVLAALIAGTKIVNAFPVLAAAVTLLICAVGLWQRDRVRATRYLVIAIGVLAAVFVVYEGWAIFQHHRGDPHWVNPIASVSSAKINGAPFDEIFSTSFTGVGVVGGGFLPGGFANEWTTVLERLWAILGIAAIAATLTIRRPGSARWAIALTAAIGALSYPLVVEVQVYLDEHRYFPAVAQRYGFAYIPMIIAVTAFIADDRRLGRWFVGFTVAAVAIGLYAGF